MGTVGMELSFQAFGVSYIKEMGGVHENAISTFATPGWTIHYYAGMEKDQAISCAIKRRPRGWISLYIDFRAGLAQDPALLIKAQCCESAALLSCPHGYLFSASIMR